MVVLDVGHHVLDDPSYGDPVDLQLGLVLEKLQEVLSKVLVEVAGSAESACCCETWGEQSRVSYLPPWGTTSLLSLSGSWFSILYVTASTVPPPGIVSYAPHIGTKTHTRVQEHHSIPTL